MLKNKKEKGFTLVEILLVVGFIALASIGIYAVYNKIATNHKANETVTQINTIVSGIRTLYASQQRFLSLSNDVVIKGRIAPLNMISDGTLIDKFGNEVLVYATSYGGGLANVITIEMNDVPSDACVKIAPVLKDSVDSISVNNDGFVKLMGYGLNITRLTTRCGASDGAQMRFYFRATQANAY